MHADLNVTDYMEYAMLMIGWVVNNAIWTIMDTTGLAALPFVLMIAGTWYRVNKEGADEGNKGALLVNRVAANILSMMVCYMLTCAPLLSLSFNPVDMVTRSESGQSCSVSVIGHGSWGSNTLDSISGETASIPIWWAFIHASAKGMTNAAITAIPCQPDMEAIATEVNTQSIQDPELAREVGEFQQQCYGPARNKLFRSGDINSTKAEDTDWIGSEYFQDTSGYYDSFYAQQPVTGFTYESSRDQARPGTGPGEAGYPTCNEWWSDSSNGLYQRLHDQISTNVWDDLSSVASYVSGGTQSTEDAAIRRLVSPRSGSAAGNQTQVVQGYGSLDGNDRNLLDLVSEGAGFIGGNWKMATMKPMIDVLRQALPMVQDIFEMVIVICLPFVIVISGYSFKAVGTATFGLFGIMFLTFWWELARWINNNLITLLYGSNAISGHVTMEQFLNADVSGYDQMVLQFVQWALYLVLPMVWMGVLGWGGYQVGSMATSLSNATKPAQEAGQAGGALVGKGMSAGFDVATGGEGRLLPKVSKE